MTHSIQASLFTQGRLYDHRNYPGLFYNVVVNTESGDSFTYEVEADTFADATRQAENLANDLMEDITFIEVYLMQ